MTDEEFLKLASACGARRWTIDSYVPTVEFEEDTSLTPCREVERRTLERAALYFADQMDGSDVKDKQLNKFLWAVAQQLRAMIKEKE